MTEMATPLPDYRTPVGGEGPSSQGLDGAHLKPCLHYSDFQSVFHTLMFTADQNIGTPHFPVLYFMALYRY